MYGASIPFFLSPLAYLPNSIFLLLKGVISSFCYPETSRIPFDTIGLEPVNAERIYACVREREREWVSDGREIGEEDDREIRAWIESCYGPLKDRRCTHTFVGTHA